MKNKNTPRGNGQNEKFNQLRNYNKLFHTDGETKGEWSIMKLELAMKLMCQYRYDMKITKFYRPCRSGSGTFATKVFEIQLFDDESGDWVGIHLPSRYSSVLSPFIKNDE